MTQTLRIVCISDTHKYHRKIDIPDGDILLHAGDMSGRGELDVIADFNDFLGELPHRHKIVIAGNHDFAFERTPQEAQALMTNCTYLQDELVEVEGLRIYGTPWQPWFFNWAFNLQRGPEILEKWKLIPDHVDILISHGPPLGHGDLTARGEQVGCADLFDEITHRIKPRYHIFGHIHEAYGTTTDGTTTFINASTCNLAYKPIHPPVVIEVAVSIAKFPVGPDSR